MKMYNLFPLLAGRLPDWTGHIDRASAMDFDWIFVNPIQKPGNSGSLYSIVDYFEISPLFLDPQSRLSAEEQVRAFTHEAARRGMGVMIDLVINHCAYDSDLLREHPEWFFREHDGSIAHPFCMENGHKVVWQDLARFDHRNTPDREGLYRYLKSVVDFLLDLGFRGFRCDAAYQIPGDLWHRLINEVRGQYDDVVFAAETLGCTADATKATANAGFDYVFNSSKWWDFESPWLLEQYHLVRETVRSISFPENHDTERLFQESGGNISAMKQRYLFAASFSAGVAITMGFEFGFRHRLHVVDTRPEHWESTDVDLQDFIRRVNRLKTGHAIFNEECPTTILRCDNPAVLLMWKASTQSPEEALVILNKDPWNRQHLYVDNLRTFTQAGAPLVDVSPEDPMEYLPAPFSYELRPGEGRVMVTRRD